jgi:hypothetical protein
MIFENIRRKAVRILLIALLVLLSLFSNDLFFDTPDKTIWENSVFTGLPDIVSPELSILISMILLLTAGMLIYNISFEHLSIFGREHLLVWLWVIMVGGFSFLHPLSGIHFAVVFILLSYNIFFKIYKQTNDYRIIFMAPMYLGIATLFYNFAIYLFIPYIISLYRFKIARLRDWIISLSGLLIPYYFAIFVSYFLNGNWRYPVETTIDNIVPNNFSLQIAEMTTIQYILCITIATLTAIGLCMPLRSSRKGMNQKTISCMRLFSTLLFFSILIFLLFTPESKLLLMIILIPATVYIRILFVKITSNIIANSLLLLLITISVIALT